MFWSNQFFLSGIDGDVRSLAVYNGDLIVGGDFTLADDKTVNNIARWDGSSWNAMGTGTNGIVHSLTLFGADLIAGGTFITAGGITVNRVAQWNGTEWVEKVKLTASDGDTFDKFGVSVAISQDTIVIGASDDEHNIGTDTGSAYVFQWDDEGWKE